MIAVGTSIPAKDEREALVEHPTTPPSFPLSEEDDAFGLGRSPNIPVTEKMMLVHDLRLTPRQ